MGAGARELKLGPLHIPLGKPKFELLRKSKAFWKVLGENGVKATVLRVPITFPPEKVDGQMLSAMCVPDLRGTQGTFSHFSTSEPGSGETTGGVRILLQRDGEKWLGDLHGPDNPADGKPFTLQVSATVDAAAKKADFQVGDQRFSLGAEVNSEWIPVKFAGGKAHGICKFRVTSFDAPFAFYVSPVHIDPEHPAMSIAHPSHYSIALAKLQGPYATLGLAEDTWALNERVLDEQGFLDQAWEIHAEREKQFFHTLDRQRSGAISVVFDATDRVQHMFFRYLDPKHPANAGKDTQTHRDTIKELYMRADDLVGRTMAKMRKDDVLFVVSDHGFKTFQRGVNLNVWLRDNGYLFLQSDPQDGALPPLADDFMAEPTEIDWSRTRAYASGLGGFYLNLKGREHQGIVELQEAEALLRELAAALKSLRDPDRDVPCVNEIWLGHEVYKGPYAENGPDLVMGFKVGYRTDWDAAIGRVGPSVFQDNTRSWSGDHCVDPRLVPGIFFSSIPFAEPRPSLTDLAPTILDLFGIATPAYMTGKSLMPLEK
jgi:predicted AlkP superfamily phosphohydrolase/phosphomutase